MRERKNANPNGEVIRRITFVLNTPSEFSSLSGTNDSHHPKDVNRIPKIIRICCKNMSNNRKAHIFEISYDLFYHLNLIYLLVVPRQTSTDTLVWSYLSIEVSAKPMLHLIALLAQQRQEKKLQFS